MPTIEMLILACTLGTLAMWWYDHPRGESLPTYAVLPLAFLTFLRWRSLRRVDTVRPPIEVEITETNVVTVSSGAYSDVAWIDVEHVDEWHGFWFGYGAREPLFVLPQECLTSAQVAELRAFMSRRGLILVT